jgi:uncharacterized protein
MTRFNRLIVLWPKLTLLIGFLLTIFLGFHAWHIRTDSSLENLYAQDDPNKTYYEKVRAIFGSDNMAVIGVVTGNVYNPATLERIRRITAAVEKVDGVESVQSLTNVPDLLADVLDPPLLIPRIPLDPATLGTIRRKIASSPIYLNVVSRDGHGAAILIFLKQQTAEDEAAQRRRDDRLQEIVAREQGPDQLFLTGMEHITLNSQKLMQRDLRTFTPLSLAIIMVVLGICFRNVRGVLLPVMSVLCGAVWTLGIMVLAGEAITIGTLVLPSLLIVIGSTYSIYIIAQYEDEIHKGGTAREVVLRSLTRVSIPVTVAAFTTVAGFTTLLVNRVSTIRALGFYAAVGFACLTVVVLTLMPAALALLPLPQRKPANQSERLTALLARVGHFDRDHRIAIMVTAALLIVPCVWGVSRIRADSNFIQYLKKNSPVRQANEIIGEKIGGTQNFDVIINTNKRDGAINLDLLKRIKGLQAYLATLPGIDRTISIVDFCELVDRAIQTDGPRRRSSTEGGDTPPSPTSVGPVTTFWQHPEQLKGVRQLVYYNQQQHGSVNAVLNADSSIARIVVRTRLTSSSDIVNAANEVRRYGIDHFPPEVTVQPTGTLILLNEATEDIIWGQITSLGFALVVIFGVLSLLFLSAKVGFLSLLPNILAILLLFGVMGLAGITLNLGTSIIASIAIGIAVEDAIRYLARLSDEIRTTHDQEKALFQTISTVGKPIIYASTALGLGFMVFLFSSFVPIQKFGLMTALTIVAAFVNDLVLLPALLATTRIITLWDLLYLKLGRDPHRTIGLFEGLRPSQAKIVTLMGELRAFPHEQAIVRQGELGNEMFVLIDGKAEVQVTVNGHTRVVQELGRGDVFGEMGLVRHHERTADVIARGDVEVLAVNERFLARMQRRYPRIGAKVFLNVAKILSDRLEREITRA